MTSNTTKPELTQPEPETAAHLFDNWFDPIETVACAIGFANSSMP